jgi:XisH protein
MWRRHALESKHESVIRTFIYEFHLAIGQYRNYQLALLQEDPECVLYLAVPEDAYDRFFTLQFIQDALRYNEVRYIVYDVQTEVIVRWQS